MSRIFGIDLGTTNSLIAVMEDAGPRIIGDPATGATLLPSVVALGPEGTIGVGLKAAELEGKLDDWGRGQGPGDQAGSAPAAVVVRSVKRYMGLGGAEVAPEDRIRYSFADLGGPVVRFQVSGRLYTPPQVSAEILRALKARVKASSGESVERVVITVPAYFNDAQRQATKDAGRLAEVEVVRLVNEPTAASLAYGLNAMTAGRIAVYDLGGGTFDVSLLSVKEGIFEVLATNGDTHLGGDDIDRLIEEWLMEQLSPPLRQSRQLWRAARTAAEAAKCRLSAAERTELVLQAADITVRRELERSQLERMAEPLVNRTLACCRRALEDAKLKPEELDAVVLVGGATRMPLVRRRVAELFGRQPLCSINPDEVVALGAAVQAAVLTGGRKDMLLLDVVPLSLGIETMGGVMERLIHRNTTIPTSVTEMFTTAVDDQTHVDIHVVQGEREIAHDNRSLARFKLGPLEPAPAGTPRIEVTFLIDANGILNVTARDQRTGREHSLEVKPSYGLTEEEIERMLEESIERGEQDLEQRMLAVARNQADQILQAARRQLANFPALVEPQERTAIDRCAARLEAARLGTDHELIARLTQELNELTTPFAERIMNQAIKQALERKSVEQLP